MIWQTIRSAVTTSITFKPSTTVVVRVVQPCPGFGLRLPVTCVYDDRIEITDSSRYFSARCEK